MKKRFIILVVIAITIALVGLLGIQLYWIRNAVAIKEVNFDRGVSEAATRAISQFNKQELARKMMEQQEHNQHLNQLSQMLDSLNQLYYNRIFSQQGEAAQQGRTSGILQAEIDMPLSGQLSNRQQSSASDTSIVISGRSRYPGTAPGYLPDNRRQGSNDPFSRFFERSQIINDLFDELFSRRYTFQVTNESSISSLDSLLGEELSRQGIRTPYEFGIYNPAGHALVREKTGNHSQQLLESPYAFQLFPNDIFMNPEYLLLHFPQQERYILSQMNTMLGTSIVLLLVIISSFAITILTIIRQKKLSVMKNDFINNMTHELKTPISTISLACQALSDQDVQKSENLYQNYINVINEENQRLGLLTEKVLQTALIEKAKIRLNTTGLDLHDLIENAIQKIGIQVEARHGKITTHFDADYSFVQGDKVHLTNVFSNLLDNANKYSPHNPQITVTTKNSSHGIIVHIDDQGVGISQANQKKIFDNLYRVSTGNVHDVKGFGLGLSYVKAIVEKHGGHISLESEPNKGSRFTVFIPFAYNAKGNEQTNN
ncbi:MAG: sensor histidine kinase [Bacteroidales bacterium]